MSSAVIHCGQVFEGLRHHNAIIAAVAATGVKPVKGCQGFLDDEGVFHDRHRSREIAVEAGQVADGDTHDQHILYSEDVW